uniref:Uncharacterized protein n=1 Tax=Octopus bimaculoides TaxID=37653 RepID=A0A0L8HGB8_OCTBM
MMSYKKILTKGNGIQPKGNKQTNKKVFEIFSFQTPEENLQAGWLKHILLT